VHQRCQSPGGRGLRPMGPAFAPRTITQGALARDLPETALHVTSRRLTTRPSTAPLTSVVVWARDVLRGVVNSPSSNGMQGVRGSNPLSSTAFHQVKRDKRQPQRPGQPQQNPNPASGKPATRRFGSEGPSSRSEARYPCRWARTRGLPARPSEADQVDATGRGRATL
jgi:hypothetical protein